MRWTTLQVTNEEWRAHCSVLFQSKCHRLLWIRIYSHTFIPLSRSLWPESMFYSQLCTFTLSSWPRHNRILLYNRMTHNNFLSECDGNRTNERREWLFWISIQTKRQTCVLNMSTKSMFNRLGVAPRTPNPGHMGNLCLLSILFTAILQLNKIRHFIAPHGVVEVPENNIWCVSEAENRSDDIIREFLFFRFWVTITHRPLANTIYRNILDETCSTVIESESHLVVAVINCANIPYSPCPNQFLHYVFNASGMLGLEREREKWNTNWAQQIFSICT